MTNTPDWKPVAKALLGTWPSQVTAWGPEGISAYVSELGARSLDPARALIAIRSYDPDADFPPSAAKLAQVARHDPTAPTFAEAVQLIFRPNGVLSARSDEHRSFWELGERDKADEAAMLERAFEVHPLLGAFVRDQGIRRLRGLDLEGQWGGAQRRDLGLAWAAFTEKNDGREIAALVAGRGRGTLGRVDPLRALALVRPKLGAGDDAA